jgi:asparagine synthase (glutamine-hydrolysing)
VCGFAGFVGATTLAPDDVPEMLRGMAAELRHRGPDDEGLYWSGPESVGLVHRRLSIIDLSEQGHQPMESRCRRFVIVYNGEVYNFLAIRRELEAVGSVFRGDSDTEVILEAIARWGLSRALPKFIGMFGFAIWDRRDRALTLVRDRLGIKPVYFAVADRFAIFASELRPFRHFSAWQAPIDRDALADYMDLGYISVPRTIYQGVEKLPPGCLLRIAVREDGVRAGPVEPYWTLAGVVNKRTETSGWSEGQALEELRRKVEVAVSDRLIADVPLGAFLSGGIDSTTVAAVMQHRSARPVRTFSIGFEDQAYDEAGHAAKIASFLGTEHTEHYLTERDLLDLIPDLPRISDEPFADPSQLPTLLLARITRRHVTVALSGDGGDELFAGYVRHLRAKQIDSVRRRLPGSLRAGIARLLTCVPEAAWDRIYRATYRALPNSYRMTLPGDKLRKLARVLAPSEGDDLYRMTLSQWDNEPPVIGGRSGECQRWWQWPATDLPLVEKFMYRDMLGYLHDDVLTKVDRCSMAESLEARVPLLDHRLVEFSWTLPLRFKLVAGQGKYLMRRLLAELVPAELWERPKMGFAIPVGRWLQNGLKAWADDLLATDRLRRQGLLDAAVVAKLWSEHRSGRGYHPYRLWNVLMFQSWLQEYGED